MEILIICEGRKRDYTKYVNPTNDMRQIDMNIKLSNYFDSEDSVV